MSTIDPVFYLILVDQNEQEIGRPFWSAMDPLPPFVRFGVGGERLFARRGLTRTYVEVTNNVEIPIVTN